ncbi:MAG: hypothetical protein ACOY93_08650 [Bacillota bacterium]
MNASGFNGPPPPVEGLWAETKAEAWDLYRANAESHGYPVPVGGRWLVPQAIRALNEQLATAATNRFMVQGQPVLPHREWKRTRGALLPGEGQAYGWFAAHRDECAGPPQPHDFEFWLVPTLDGKPREVRPLEDRPMTTPHKGSAAEAARLHDEDRRRISGRIARRRRGGERDDDDQPQQATLFG